MAAGDILLVRGTPVSFQDSAGTVALTLNNLAAGAVRVSDRHDFGVSPQPDQYEWRATFQWTTPTVGESADIYLATSDGSNVDGGVGLVDALITLDDLPNLYYLGSVVVTSNTGGHDMTSSGICRFAARYASIAVHCNGAIGLTNSANVSRVFLTPVHYQGQS